MSKETLTLEQNVTLLNGALGTQKVYVDNENTFVIEHGDQSIILSESNAQSLANLLQTAIVMRKKEKINPNTTD